MKYCRKCDTMKPRDQFFRDARKKDGLHTLCKKCKYEGKKEWRRNGGLEKEKPGKAKWIENNKDRHRELQRKYAIARREVWQHIRDVWPEPEKPNEAPWPTNHSRLDDLKFAFVCQHDMKSIARARGWSGWGPYKPRSFQGVIKRWYSEAPERGKRPAGLQMDHIVPLAGVNFCGLDVPWNIQMVSKEYNRYKSNRLERGTGWGPDWNFEEVEPPSETDKKPTT